MAGQDPAHTLMMFFNVPVPTARLKWVLYRTLCWQLWCLCSIWETLRAQVVLLISEQWLEGKEIFGTVMMYGLKNYFVNSLYWNWLNSASSYLFSFSIPYPQQCHFDAKKVMDPGTKKVQFEKYEVSLKTTPSKWINSISHKWKKIAKKHEQERTAFLSLSEWCNNTSANQQDTGTRPIKGGWNHQPSQPAPCSFTCHLRQSCTE